MLGKKKLAIKMPHHPESQAADKRKESGPFGNLVKVGEVQELTNPSSKRAQHQEHRGCGGGVTSTILTVRHPNYKYWGKGKQEKDPAGKYGGGQPERRPNY